MRPGPTPEGIAPSGPPAEYFKRRKPLGWEGTVGGWQEVTVLCHDATHDWPDGRPLCFL